MGPPRPLSCLLPDSQCSAAAHCADTGASYLGSNPSSATVCGRVLQRNTTSRMYTVYTEIDKESAHVIVATDKSPNLQGDLASWRSRRADGVVWFSSKG